MMQQPTISGLHVRTTADALIIFHAVRHDILHMVKRRLDSEERRNITPGDVFVWEERSTNPDASGLGIERWTDSIRWGPSRTKDDFLFYHEKHDSDANVVTEGSSNSLYGRQPLIKQTYSVYVELDDRRAKWHLIAYFTRDTCNHLKTVDDYPHLAAIPVPQGAYRAARNPKRPSRETNSPPPHHPYQHQMRDATSPEDTFSMHNDGNHRMRLAPLKYLQAMPPPRRHVLDEMALNLLTIRSDTFTSSHGVPHFRYSV
ncbi:hypothetical protein BYT27DRAFT_7180681 [Phlegmacium glaucopus]|nr:hypothetical protein BYT27DRAFT_7180681 [Phlegmacium glaucopus]